MSLERKLLGRWHNGDLLPEEYMQLMKETKELLAQPEHNNTQYLLDQVARLTAENAMLKEKWLAQPEQEPVDWMYNRSYGDDGLFVECVTTDYWEIDDQQQELGNCSNIRPLYTSPKREPLSEEAVSELLMGGFSTHLMDLVRMLEKAHGIGGE